MSMGLRSAPQRLRLNVAPVWDTRPKGQDYAKAGQENSGCIPLILGSSTFRNSEHPQFIFSGNLNGGQILYEDAPLALNTPHFVKSRCYVPPAGEYSVFNTTSSQFEPFTSFTYRVWSGKGNWQTGESPALDGSEHSGVFLELSEPYQVEIVVTPRF